MTNIRNWLSPPDPWKIFNIACKSRHSGTGAWFINGNTFSEWKASGPSSLLWINGKCQLTPDVDIFSHKLTTFTCHSGCWQEHSLVSESFHIFVLRTYDVQFHHHRGDPDNAEI